MLGFTQHAHGRIVDRLAQVITPADIWRAVARFDGQYKVGETHVLVKRLDSTLVLADGSTGDEVWAVVKRRPGEDTAHIVTAMLRGSWQPRRGDYRLDGRG